MNKNLIFLSFFITTVFCRLNVCKTSWLITCLKARSPRELKEQKELKELNNYCVFVNQDDDMFDSDGLRFSLKYDSICNICRNKRNLFFSDETCEKFPESHQFQSKFYIKIQKNNLNGYLAIEADNNQIIFPSYVDAKFQDEYEILAQIGKGNYARVYSAVQKSSGVKFAVKCFQKQKLQEIDKGMLSLHNELKIMRKIKEHENVIKLFEVFEGENTFYFVMEIVDGNSLYEEIKKKQNKPFHEDEIKDILQKLIKGISYLQQFNIMHRDIKPENILLERKEGKNTVKIVDFGLASFADEFPYIFPKCGTPGFVAPEIANLIDKSKGYSIICDVFSIGVIFHILLTGESIFPGKKFNDVLTKNKQCEINWNSQLYDGLNIYCKNLLQNMLQKCPEKRINCQECLEHPYFDFQKKLQLEFGKNEDYFNCLKDKNQILSQKGIKLNGNFEFFNDFGIKEDLYNLQLKAINFQKNCKYYYINFFIYLFYFFQKKRKL
ncbi:protein kinase domain protein [Ichthyophthirius multifiliis]|uniref:non-specific serine/threonine protein kinase n=1 Tax=Ichthyophthirius multifiliis TaxID=5932 RepID=G0QL79_ICHMU|nr:protein kinase domain protein [Ichthyophthirius multifiliis]EGR34026.1 protein kinase domain protein [Ichthyophthirius multifiliis]|eukprot:XP_004039330.1 protein kinase domain protein [Ichthyophthirius multifiliis]